jgi:hypothetical protein
MALPHPTLVQRGTIRPEVLRAMAILIVVLVAMAVLTALVGVVQSGPSYDLIPDPAGALGF